MSTAAVWSDSTGTRLPELTAANPTTLYGYAKLSAERLIADSIVQDKISSAVVLRCNNTYGPKDHGLHTFGISGPEAMTIAAMAETLAKVLGITRDVDWKPKNPDRARHIIINTEKARREFGWSPRISFEQGCRLYAASIQGEQSLDGRNSARKVCY